jgi:2-hydroxymuconate-semialdehyde hydrolase
MKNAEVGQSVSANGLATNYHDYGSGDPVLLLHGSGPGVSAWANWRLALPALGERYRTVAPDLLGFGYTERPQNPHYTMPEWLEHTLAFMDAVGLEQTHVVGNSFGGALALHLADAAPERVKRLVLMGSVGVKFVITPGLESVWGFEPSFQAMRDLIDLFAYDTSLVSDDLAVMRLAAAERPGVQEAFAAMFPTPRQACVDALAIPTDRLAVLPHSTLILHGREDQVIPLECSLTLHQQIPNSQLHVFGHCGHWTQIEHADTFHRLVGDFLAET